MESIPEELKCIIETKDGPVCGLLAEQTEEIHYIFHGIPYATPPVGRLRFLPPQQIQPWKDTLDCTKPPDWPLNPYAENIEAQYGIKSSEDCLYIQIHTPNMKPKEIMPVMFWIGGYNFTVNMDFNFDPNLIVDQNIVFVRCGFRMGPFGFLNINDYTAPGNCGLKDVVMALKWVQRNIRMFGGDPNNVTIFGNSSGGAMVHLMMLSPMATGLFHKAIIQSVSSLNNWTLDKNPYHVVVDLAQRLGIKKTSLPDIVEELRCVPALDILETFKNMMKDHKTDIINAIFKPSIEADLEGQPAFITKSPALLIKSGNFNKVPLIIGSNNVEGIALEFSIKDFYTDYKKYNDDVSLLVPKSLVNDDKYSKIIGHKLLKFYLAGDEYLREDTRAQHIQLISDYYFLYYVNKTVRFHSQNTPENPIYYYIVNYAGEWAVPKDQAYFNTAGHCAELPFLFRLKLPNICKGSRDSISTRSKMVKMWTNFAKFGNPTPEEDDDLLQITWDPVESEDKLNYLCIGSELTKGRNPFKERMKFWDDLHKEYAFFRTIIHFNDIGVACLD